jgi:hypothetical protein
LVNLVYGKNVLQLLDKWVGGVLQLEKRSEIMRVTLCLEKTIVGRKKYYLIVNEIFYVKVNKRTFNDLAKFLEIDIGDSKNGE